MTIPDEPYEISWAQVKRTLEAGFPGAYGILGRGDNNPDVRINIDPARPSLSLTVPIQTQEQVKLGAEHIDTQCLRTGPETFELAISTDRREYFREFLSFCNNIAAFICIDGMPPGAATHKAYSRYRALLQAASVMSEDQIAGLWGELWVLDSLCRELGKDLVQAWVGPTRDTHDFRFGGIELEVKTTRSAKRIHEIDGLSQLTPSDQHILSLISITIERTMGVVGESLAGVVSRMGSWLGHPHDVTFRDLITQAGYREEHAEHYQNLFTIRSQPMLIPLDDEFPRITLQQISDLAIDVLRIRSLRYKADLSNLGTEFCPRDLMKVAADIPSGPE